MGNVCRSQPCPAAIPRFGSGEAQVQVGGMHPVSCNALRVRTRWCNEDVGNFDVLCFCRKQGPRASVKSIIKEYLKDVPRGKRHMFSRKAIGIAIEDVKKEKAKFEKSEATRKTKRNANKRRVIRV